MCVVVFCVRWLLSGWLQFEWLWHPGHCFLGHLCMFVCGGVLGLQECSVGCSVDPGDSVWWVCFCQIAVLVFSKSQVGGCTCRRVRVLLSPNGCCCQL